MILIALVTSLGGCSVYKVDVQQGNTLEADQVAELQTGMSKEQVLYLLGTPLLRDPFHPQRWDYVYSFKPGGGELKSAHLSLYFTDEMLSRIDRRDFRDYRELYRPTGSGRRDDTASQSLGGGNSGPAPPRQPPGTGLPSP